MDGPEQPAPGFGPVRSEAGQVTHPSERRVPYQRAPRAPPPVPFITWPLTYDDPSDARNTAPRATTSPGAIRPAAVPAFIASRRSGGNSSNGLGVATKAGEIALEPMPSCPYIAAVYAVITSRAPLAEP